MTDASVRPGAFTGGSLDAEGWEAADVTNYYHWSYTDFLSVARDLGLVGEGNVPDTNPYFESTVYERDNDRTCTAPRR
jgi:hypothetical protein